MASSQSLNLDLRQQLRLSAQQLRFVKLLEFNAPELEEAVERELEDNPALEVAEDSPAKEEALPYYRTRARNSSPDDGTDYEFSPPDPDESLYDSLLAQLAERNLSEHVHEAAEYIIGNLDPNGYLRRPLQGIINDMAFSAGIEVTQEEAEEALRVVKELEPHGIGASDLRESLLLQLRAMPASETRDDALRIVDEQFEALAMRHSHRLVSSLRLTQERVQQALALIAGLNPKPGAALGSDGFSNNVVVPDLVVNNEDGRLTVASASSIPELAIERSFAEAMTELDKSKEKGKRKGSEFITSRFNDARDFIRILGQRQETLLNVMGAILKIQEEYFLTQDVYKLKPMMIKDISALTGYDASVVSRATNNKYVATPWGVFPLRFFFSDSIGDEGEEAGEALTNRKVEAEIRRIVDGEEKARPLSDERIRELIAEKGFDISRRTVAKYRDRLGIPVARLRKGM